VPGRQLPKKKSCMVNTKTDRKKAAGVYSLLLFKGKKADGGTRKERKQNHRKGDDNGASKAQRGGKKKRGLGENLIGT